MRLIDRYILRNFLVPFFYCLLSFAAIWLIFDLSDNAPDFIEAKSSVGEIAHFYATQLPQIVIISLPIGIVLALLYSLGRMSRANEIVSLFGAGQSVSRLLIPLVGVGLLATGASLLLNYQLVPHAEAAKEQLLKGLNEKKDPGEEVLKGQLFRDRKSGRTWFVRELRRDIGQLREVLVIQQDANQNIVEKYYAQSAQYHEQNGTWVLENGKRVRFNREGDIVNEELWLDGRRRLHWSETPWRIASGSLEPQKLSVPELQEYLRYNSDFPATQLAPYRTYLHHRWALPWACVIAVLVAAPLGMVYSQRGVLAGVTAALFIFFGMLFLMNLFLALGKGSRISPSLAAWAPIIIFLAVGLLLLFLRSTNREAPKLSSLWS